ncbi:MAG: sphingomyelin phosphodiesterase [Pseudomonadota bacterium]|nr:sphingomyelin phosphodiesterase [Pseudomonadota bacterium]
MTGTSFAARTHLQTALRALALLLVTNAVSAGDGIIERSYFLANSFNVLAYNIYMRPTTLFANDQSDRGAVLPSKLRGFDVIVFSEAFDDTVRNQLLADLRGEYPHRTRILGADRGVEQDGGVIIVSRWPITAEAQRLYGDVCVGDDCKADKGVLYARSEKHGQTYHVFASHTQAGDGTEQQQTRMRQLGIIKSFIDGRGLSDTEPVFIAGDLNVNKYDAGEYAAMLRILDAWYPQPFGHPYTVDSTSNRRAGGRSYLDYVLVSNRHLQPMNAIIETLIPRSPTPFGGDYDLSDHFPVFGHFMFPSPAATIAATGD